MLVDEHPVSAFYVDVNAADEHGKVATTPDALVEGYDGKPDPGVGQYVWAVDADDHACVALITEHYGEWIQLHMDESQWVPFAAVMSGTEANDKDVRVALPGVDFEDAVRAALRTPPPQTD